MENRRLGREKSDFMLAINGLIESVNSRKIIIKNNYN